jgi:Holliday junction resolvase
MAITPEGKVKKEVVNLMNKYDVYYFFPATHGYGRSGVPDVVGCVRGKFIAIECKAGDNKPTALQEREISNIQKAKGHVMVVNEGNIDLLEQVLKELTHDKKGSNK